MSSPAEYEATFRPEFGDQFATLQPKERGHAIGVVANTLASLAMNQANIIDADGMAATMKTLSPRSNELIAALVQDESASYLFPQSARICAVIRTAISESQKHFLPSITSIKLS